MTYADGTEQVIKSDDTWKTSAAGPIRYDNHYLGETYDARRELAGLGRARLRRRAPGRRPARCTGPAGTLRAQNLERTS